MPEASEFSSIVFGVHVRVGISPETIRDISCVSAGVACISEGLGWTIIYVSSQLLAMILFTCKPVPLFRGPSC